MISLIQPSRQRPAKARETLNRWAHKAKGEYEHILSLDSDDPTLGQYQQAFMLAPYSKTITNNNRSAVDAINNAVQHCTSDIFVVVSDDFDCPDGWDSQILSAVIGKKDWILKTPDGIQDWIITLPIMDRAYYNRFGYIYYPEFKHMFCDTFMTCVADLIGRKLEANIQFNHNHYSIGKSERDSVSIAADKTWDEGERIFLGLARKNYLLTAEQTKGQIKNQGYLNWIKGKI